ncbi:MAG: polysaccharide deacetylase family protein [Chloroflexi bacterium]|nr:polysaccharide deacetylase family protein [Chloroflexota bacterium]
MPKLNVLLIVGAIVALLLVSLGLTKTPDVEPTSLPASQFSSTQQPTVEPSPTRTPCPTVPSDPPTDTPTVIASEPPPATLTSAPTAIPTPMPSPEKPESVEIQFDIPLYQPNKMGDILVLEYHRIARPEGRWTRTPENFRDDLEYLLAHGYYPVNLIDIVRKNLDHVPLGRRPVVLTFDDSTIGQFHYLEDGSIDPDCAVGILLSMHETYGDHWPLRATFFVLLNADEPGPFLFHQSESGPQKVRALVDWGIEVGSHTISHANLSQITAGEIKWELAVSQNRIATLVPGHTPRSFSVPYGAYPGDVSLLKGGYSESADLDYYYEAAVQVGNGPAPSPFSSDFDSYFIPRLQAFQASLDQWFSYYERYPEHYYVSGGAKPEPLNQHKYREPWLTGETRPMCSGMNADLDVKYLPNPFNTCDVCLEKKSVHQSDREP